MWLHLLVFAGVRLVAAFAYDLLGAGEYRAGLDYLGLLMLGNFFFLAGNLFAAGISYAKKTHLSIVAFCGPGAFNVVLNLIFIPRYGAPWAPVLLAAENLRGARRFSTLVVQDGGTARSRKRRRRASARTIARSVRVRPDGPDREVRQPQPPSSPAAPPWFAETQAGGATLWSHTLPVTQSDDRAQVFLHAPSALHT
jgi:hypothetical protein